MTSVTPTWAPPPSTNSPKTSKTPPWPAEINRLGRTIWNWRHQIANWHAARSHQRSHRGHHQPDQTRQTRRLRIHQLRQLPDPGPALRQQAQLGPPRHPHSPLKSEEPPNGSNEPRSGSPTSTTTESAPCSTPADPTGRCSTPSPRPETRRAALLELALVGGPLQESVRPLDDGREAVGPGRSRVVHADQSDSGTGHERDSGQRHRHNRPPPASNPKAERRRSSPCPCTRAGCGRSVLCRRHGASVTRTPRPTESSRTSRPSSDSTDPSTHRIVAAGDLNMAAFLYRARNLIAAS